MNASHIPFTNLTVSKSFEGGNEKKPALKVHAIAIALQSSSIQEITNAERQKLSCQLKITKTHHSGMPGQPIKTSQFKQNFMYGWVVLTNIKPYCIKIY
jgi:hypothetical protein